MGENEAKREQERMGTGTEAPPIRSKLLYMRPIWPHDTLIVPLTTYRISDIRHKTLQTHGGVTAHGTRQHLN